MAPPFGRFVSGLVVLSWLAMTAQACVFVGRYGHNLPRQDEWEFVPVLTGHADSVRWVVSKHAEHRFPLARAVYLGLHAGSGRDFRAGMWVTVALLSASAALLLLAARKSRGRSDLIDLLVPVLLLNAGHAENFTMGYQIAFTLTVGLLAAFAGVAVWADRIGPRRAAGLCGLATLGVALGGGHRLGVRPRPGPVHGVRRRRRLPSVPAPRSGRRRPRILAGTGRPLCGREFGRVETRRRDDAQ